MSNWDNRAGVWFCSFGWIIVSDSAYTSPKSRSPARRCKVELSLAEEVSHFPPNDSLTPSSAGIDWSQHHRQLHLGCQRFDLPVPQGELIVFARRNRSALIRRCSQYINITRGQIITAIVGGWAFVPWKILSSGTSFLNFM